MAEAAALRRALKESKRKQEAAGFPGLEKRSLGGVEWYVQPTTKPALTYRSDRPGGTVDRDEPFGYAPRGSAKRRKIDVDAAVWRLSGDAENDFLGMRCVRVAVLSGQRLEIACLVDGFRDEADAALPDGVRRVYRCRDADDGTLHQLSAGEASHGIARADEDLERRRLADEKEKRAERREEAEARRLDALAAADAADAAIEAESRSWVFDCPCGVSGRDYDDGEDMIQCGSCLAWAHDACVVERLRGARGAPKLAALRFGAYRCRACAPARYREAFRCYCDPDAVSFDDDGEDRLRCEACLSYCHVFCALANPDAACPTCALAARAPACPAGARRVVSARGFSVFARSDARCRDETIVREVVGDGAYERPAMGFEVVPGETWLDVGAHIGVFSSLCLQAGADVVAVEPDADNFRLLLANGALNAVHDAAAEFTALNVAVTDRHEASTTLFRHPRGIAFRHSTERRLISREPDWPTAAVAATSLQRLIDDHAVDGVKIDAQGAEVGAVESVADWRRVRKLVLEYDFEYRPSLPKFHAFVARLRTHFPRIYHSKQKKSGDFSGFPNGVLVFAMREPPE